MADPTIEPVTGSVTRRTTGPTTRQKELPVYLSLEEAAACMSLSTKTIRRRIADGTIAAYQCGRRPIRIRLDDLEAALRRIPSARS
jgi:excisionase family DNA binding protein